MSSNYRTVICFQRPDNKQTFVTSWVKNYNNVAEDMREDVEMKGELHQTVEVRDFKFSNFRWFNNTYSLTPDPNLYLEHLIV